MVSYLGGVDEAGRGCVVGPLVIAGVSVRPSVVRELKDLGVKDSKKLSARQRESLYGDILKVCDRVHSTKITTTEIDRVVRTGKKYFKLNYLEAVYFARVIDELGAGKVTVDASDVLPKRFQDNICDNLKSKCEVFAAHRADRDYPLVSAASIVAKVERDKEVGRLREKHGDFGSGYPSDPTTRGFFTAMIMGGQPIPDYARKSWKTWLRLQESLEAFV
ncbi:MAG: ribonuclease HII [Thaumarchaeota archaeon]|nr:ribonuclease HII [Nitrososphaerota archaeon]